MISEDLVKQFEVLSASSTPLTVQSFSDEQPLWQKGRQTCIPEHVMKTSKRYPYLKVGRIFGMQTCRYLSIHNRYLFYFEDPQGGAVKGLCNLEHRYVEWHKTAKGKYILLLSNASQTSLLFFDNSHFWNDHKEEIVKHAVRTAFQREYNTIELLGEGSFANVFLVRNKGNGRQYAAKKICKFDKCNKSTKKLVVEERRILSQLSSCRHASKFIELYQENNEYILVLEHIEGKDLLNFIKDTPEVAADSIKLILASVLVCLKAIHSQKIIHRDIKPHNILIDSELRCKLIDFGLSLDTKNPLERHNFKKCGTVGYMAPEVFANEFSCLRAYNTQSDMFSFGIVAHMLLLGSNPIKGRSYDESYELNRECRIVLDQKKITARYGAQCFTFLQNLLERNAKHRYSAEEALNSKFLQEVLEKEDRLSISTLDERRKLSQQSIVK